MNAWDLQLDLVRWQFFCTFTMGDHNGHCPPLSWFIKGWYSVIRDIEKTLSYAPKSLLWVLRVEHGELTQRTHLHCLMAGLRRPHLNKSTCFFIMAAWEKHTRGIARVRTWEPGLDAVSYITKPGNTYELGKFGLQTCEVTLSPAADKFLKLRAKLSR